jgi:hypothetical protein
LQVAFWGKCPSSSSSSSSLISFAIFGRGNRLHERKSLLGSGLLLRWLSRSRSRLNRRSRRVWLLREEQRIKSARSSIIVVCVVLKIFK